MAANAGYPTHAQGILRKQVGLNEQNAFRCWQKLVELARMIVTADEAFQM